MLRDLALAHFDGAIWLIARWGVSTHCSQLVNRQRQPPSFPPLTSRFNLQPLWPSSPFTRLFNLPTFDLLTTCLQPLWPSHPDYQGSGTNIKNRDQGSNSKRQSTFDLSLQSAASLTTPSRLPHYQGSRMTIEDQGSNSKMQSMNIHKHDVD